jgi:NADPH:quinone reductase-like Zn-dependent oxidoreductase
MPPTRQQIAIARFGPASNLALADGPMPTPGPGEVRIAVAYAGINFADIQMRLGFYPDAPKRPFVPGYEVSGAIDAVGPGITGLRAGDQVVAGTLFGGYASHVCVPAAHAFPLPATTDLAHAAALPVNFFTAQLALFEMARVRAGDRALIECATGGVGTLAIQMARNAGAEVTGLTTSARKLGYITALGAAAHTRAAFYADPALTGYDFILQASGGSEIKRQLTRLRKTGRMVCMGMSSGVRDGRRNVVRMLTAVAQTPRLSIMKMFDANVGVFALNALHVLSDEGWVARLTERFADVDRDGLKPHVGKIFPAAEVAAAHAYLETRQAVGKVLLAF